MLLSLASFLFLQATPVPALQSIRNHFATKLGFEVEFEQKLVSKALRSSSDQASGKVKFKKPSDLTWLYEKPRFRKMSFDGSALVVDDGQTKEKVDQKTEINLQKSLAFLWGQSSENLFRIESIDAHHFRLFPKKKGEMSFQSIEVSEQNGLVSEAKVFDTLGGQSVLSFRNWKTF